MCRDYERLGVLLSQTKHIFPSYMATSLWGHRAGCSEVRKGHILEHLAPVAETVWKGLATVNLLKVCHWDRFWDLKGVAKFSGLYASYLQNKIKLSAPDATSLLSHHGLQISEPYAPKKLSWKSCLGYGGLSQ